MNVIKEYEKILRQFVNCTFRNEELDVYSDEPNQGLNIDELLALFPTQLDPKNEKSLF
jgi:hypothetical protein